jgi:hypothetical protein
MLWLTALVPPAYIAYNLTPLLTVDSAVAQAMSSDDFNLARSRLLESIKAKGQENQSFFRHGTSALVEVSAPIRAKGEDNGPTLEVGAPKLSVRYDQLILWLGISAMLAMTLRTLVPSLTRLYVGPLRVHLADDETPTKAQDPSAPLTAIALFEAEVRSAERRAEVLFARSTLLLGGGIIMAFIGVAIFYVHLAGGNEG